jgi:hypothetical protein
MSKKITLELTPAQARSLIWAINSFEMAYETYDGGPELKRDFNRAMRNLDKSYTEICQFVYPE